MPAGVLAYGADGVWDEVLGELCRRAGWQEQLGTSSPAIVETAKALGLVNSRETFGLRLYDLRDALRAGVYPIVGIGLEPYGHRGQHAQVVV